MSNDDLRGRDNWQKDGLEKATEAENNFFDVFEKYFEGTEYRIRSRPKELQHIYEDIELPDEILSEIYVPEKKPKRHGMVPDFAIDNLNTKKTIYVESKDKMVMWRVVFLRTDEEMHTNDLVSIFYQDYRRYLEKWVTYRKTFYHFGRLYRVT